MRYVRPGRVLETTAIGVILLVVSLYAGRWVADSPALAPLFTLSAVQLAVAGGIFILLPPLQMPATTRFIDGTGPLFAGKVFPFVFITIACGAISGFHALISSGTTPKLIENEKDARFIGYGAMLSESLVAVMALIAACILT